jgi:hypothetical protein
MSSESAAQHPKSSSPDEQAPRQASARQSDAALLEEALQQALDAHKAGLLAAPFGVDEVALKRARRRALRADIRRALAQKPHDRDA